MAFLIGVAARGELVAGGGDRDTHTHTGRNETFPDTHKTGAAGRRRRGVPANSRGEARPPHKSGYHKGAGGKAPA